MLMGLSLWREGIGGGEYIFAVTVISALLYIILCLLFPWNRNAPGMIFLLAALVVCEFFYDLCMALVLFPGGEYVNYGIGAVAGVAIWPLMLMICGVIVTVIHWGRVNAKSDKRQ